MTEHLHRKFVEGCFRCDLSRHEQDPVWLLEQDQRYEELLLLDQEYVP